MTNENLLKKAKAAMEFAYAPYSNFQVGAAVLCENGKVFTGCNIENASFGATNCGERTAMFNAISQGERKFLKIAIVSSGKGLTFPCGICRQVMAEFMPEGIIVLENGSGEIKEFNVKEQLPNSFSL